MKTYSPESTFGVKGLIKMGPFCPTVDFYRWFRQSSQSGHVKVKCDDMMQDTSCHYYYKSFIQMNCRSIHCLISASSFSLVSLGTLVPKGWRFSTWDLFCCFFVSAEVIKLHKNWEKQTINLQFAPSNTLYKLFGLVRTTLIKWWSWCQCPRYRGRIVDWRAICREVGWSTTARKSQGRKCFANLCHCFV